MQEQTFNKMDPNFLIFLTFVIVHICGSLSESSTSTRIHVKKKIEIPKCESYPLNCEGEELNFQETKFEESFTQKKQPLKRRRQLVGTV